MIQRNMMVLGLLTLVSATGVQAEVLITPLAGAVFSGATVKTRATYGASLGFLGNGIIGFEAEFATTPTFFGNGGQSAVFTNNNVITFMGSLLLAAHAGPVRVYGAAGAGLMKTRVTSSDGLFDVNSNDFGVNGGGGVIGFLGDHVGLRADIRYFRDLSDLNPAGNFHLQLGNKVDYWRALGGLTFKF
jgi:hypothetical protein